MTDRIYTIPAREVVAGMLTPASRKPITEEEIRALRDVLGDDGPVPVRLPGPSPRELLCSCNEWQLGQGADNAGLPASVPCGNWSTMVPPVHHADDCPVCRLRLRLWPVGATWNGEHWLLPWPDLPADETMRVRPDTLATFLDGPLLMPTLRAAFCEPEVTP